MTVDLTALPPPDVIETLSFEATLDTIKADFLDRYPAAADVIDLESEPVVKLLETVAYRELLLRARVNDAARQCHLSSASGSNLDTLAAFYGVTRLITDPGNPDAIPPVAETLETDSALRFRTQLAVEGFSTAGPVGAYRFHALSAHGDVADASVVSPTPGQVVVTVLANDGDGTPALLLLDTVAAALNGEYVRPLTDEVVVQAATIIPYTIEASLTLYPGPAPAPVLAAAQAAVTAYAAQTRRLGYDITRSGLFAALHRAGVQNVALTQPAADIVCMSNEATYCTAQTILLAGTTDV